MSILSNGQADSSFIKELSATKSFDNYKVPQPVKPIFFRSAPKGWTRYLNDKKISEDTYIRCSQYEDYLEVLCWKYGKCVFYKNRRK